VESSIYLHPNHTGRGYGTQLYQALMAQLLNRGVHAVIAGVALPNPPSLALHKKLGFHEVALFREVGWKFKHWIDVSYWELLTEV
jgi:phosphinothricin acetyltransferase